MENNSYILDFLFENQERCFFEKASVVEKICQEACAFANQNGGCIVVGVGEQHRIIGVTDEDVKRINSALLNTVTPPLPFTYSLIPRDDKQVLLYLYGKEQISHMLAAEGIIHQYLIRY